MTLERLTTIQRRIAATLQQCGRLENSVRLVAASKGQPLDKMLALYQAGQRDFGENYLQEALVKIAALPQPDILWHFIGPIQANKTRKIAEHFSWVQSVDRTLIATRLNDQRPAHLPPLNICLQVNLGETQKAGIAPDQLLDLAEHCRHLPRLRLRGLMAVPLATDDPIVQQKQFHDLFTLWITLQAQDSNIDTLSMGMSNDFEMAIKEGSNLIRIGTALFGLRE